MNKLSFNICYQFICYVDGKILRYNNYHINICSYCVVEIRVKTLMSLVAMFEQGYSL